MSLKQKQDKMNGVNPWHYRGSTDWHTREYGKNFMKYSQEKLPKVDLPIKVGGTGYIQLTGSPSVTRGWTKDEVGRMVVIVDDVLVFQRYTDGQVFMWGSIDRTSPTRSIFADIADQKFLEKLIADM
jgi:hypothetical protein